jgi:SNF2 family DNA or RNA helicase
MLIAMLPFTPGQVVQWEGRVARLGQKRPELIEYLIAEGTVDERVAGILLEKLPAVQTVAKDDSVEGLSDQLLRMDDDKLMDEILAQFGVESGRDE